MRFRLPASSIRRLNPKVSELDADSTIKEMGRASSQTYGTGTHTNKSIPACLTTSSDMLVDWLVVDSLELIVGRVRSYSTDVGSFKVFLRLKLDTATRNITAASTDVGVSSVSENEIGHRHSEHYGCIA